MASRCGDVSAGRGGSSCGVRHATACASTQQGSQWPVASPCRGTGCLAGREGRGGEGGIQDMAGTLGSQGVQSLQLYRASRHAHQ